jgi:diguanylate cyclase (GGDEF)-like protein
MSGLFVVGLALAGLLILLVSLIPIFRILERVKSGSIRSGWLVLTALVFLFVAGYAIFAWLNFETEANAADVVVAVVLFLGACFVLGIAQLSRQTAADILRIATLERDVFTDDLTGLFNRRYLSARLGEEVAKARRYSSDLSAIMVDLDHFKAVNDTYGHQTGDEVLRSVSVVVSQTIRSSDIAVRYGGEEILIVVTNTDIHGAAYLAERLRSNIAALQVRVGASEFVRISVSIGVSSLSRKDDQTDSLVKRADEALYRAKREGRDRVCEQLAA